MTNTDVSILCKDFANNSSAHIKLSKSLLSKMVQLGGLLDRLLGQLIKTGLPLMKNVLKPWAKQIHKRILGLRMTTLIISNEKMNDIMNLAYWC